MKFVQVLRTWHRHVIPFTLTLRLIAITSPSTLAVAAEIPVISPVAPHYVEQFSEEDFLAHTNAARSEAGLPALTLNTELEQAAMNKAEDMAVHGYWDHYRPGDNKAPWDFIKESGYSYKVAGENLAKGFTTVNGITNAWLASPAHRANVLSPKYSEVGFASIKANDPSGQPVLLTVQMFGGK